MSNKKFTDLQELINLTDGDIFAVVDDANAQLNSKKISALNIGKYLFSYSADGTTTSNLTSGSNLTNLKAALNGGITDDNELRASRIFYNGTYQTADEILLYDNIGGDKPVAIVSNSELENGEGFASLRNTGNGLRLQVANPAGKANAPNVGNVTTDMIEEGSTNFFFNDAAVNLALQQQFPILFNAYSDVFDDGNTIASLQNVKGTWHNPSGDWPGRTAYRLEVSGPTNGGPEITSFSAGQTVRIYGADATAGASTLQAPTAITVDIEGFQSGVNSASIGVTLEYRFAKFDLATGKVGPRSNAFTKVISTATAADTDDVYASFSRDSYIKVNFQSEISESEGVLVYRKTSTQENTGYYHLCAVISGIDLPIWKDYYTFDYTSWSGKNSADNTYPESTLVHFPAKISTATDTLGSLSNRQDETYRGWTDQQIVSVDPITGGDSYFLTFNAGSPVYVNHPQGELASTVSVAHNDTSDILTAISTKRTNGIKSLTLNAKTYNVTQIPLTSEFGLRGVLGMTELRKLPWSGYPDGINASNTIINIPGNNATSVSLDSIDFDGNVMNQYLLSSSANRFINFGASSTDVTINNCKIRDVVGDGVYAGIPLRFKMSLSEISNSSVTDRHDFFPLIIDSGINTMLNSNVIQNFTTGIDATVSTESVFANNVIKNVGTGLDIYGSTFIVSSPNVLMGPANEFLSTPDILNSEYDSINQLRERIKLQTPHYDSDTYVYQEGATPSVFNLTQNSISAVDANNNNAVINPGEVVYRVDAINVDADGAHSTYGRLIGPSLVDANNVTFTPSYLQTNKVYRIVSVGTTDWTKFGAAVNKVGARFKYNGHTTGSDWNGTTGVITAQEFAGYTTDGGTLVPPLVLRDLSSVDKTIGEFKFRIEDGGDPYTHTTYTDLTGASGAYNTTPLKNSYSAHVQATPSDTSSGKIHSFGTKHFGLQWSASYRYYAVAGVSAEGVVVGGRAITDGTWTAGTLDGNGKDSGGLNVNGGTEADASNANRHFVDFSVNIDQISHVEVGDHVVFKRDGFDPYATGSNVTKDHASTPYNGYLVAKTPLAGTNDTAVVIRYYGAVDNGSNDVDVSILNNNKGAVASDSGTLNILDDFVMAQGLIK